MSRAIALLASSIWLGLPGAVGVAFFAPPIAPIPRLEAGAQKAPVNADAQAMAAFKTRVDAYMKMRDEVTRKVPEVQETGDPAKISSRETALGEAIAARRAAAKPGDIFGDATAFFTRSITADWKSRSAADRKALFNEVPQHIRITINKPYPTGLPLVSVPAILLGRLPELPDQMEYRLIDRHFLLRDRDANLVVDILTNVLPIR